MYNNPSNPCGSVYNDHHMREIIDVAADSCLPIIADEIYENMVFTGHSFTPIASLTDEVPVLSCRGTTKRFMIPGMRLGWITVHDRHKRFGPAVSDVLPLLAGMPFATKNYNAAVSSSSDPQWTSSTVPAMDGTEFHHTGFPQGYPEPVSRLILSSLHHHRRGESLIYVPLNSSSFKSLFLSFLFLPLFVDLMCL